MQIKEFDKGGVQRNFQKGAVQPLTRGNLYWKKGGGGGGLPGHPLDLAHPYWMATLRDISKIAKLRSGLRDNNIEILKSLY